MPKQKYSMPNKCEQPTGTSQKKRHDSTIDVYPGFINQLQRQQNVPSRMCIVTDYRCICSDFQPTCQQRAPRINQHFIK